MVHGKRFPRTTKTTKGAPMLSARLLTALSLFAIVLSPQSALAAESALALKGNTIGLEWGIPFVGMLLSIATFPVIAPHFWHENFGKIAGFWAACFLIPCLLFISWETSLFVILEVLFHEYIPFILLLLALFTVAGGIHVKGTLTGHAETNVAILVIGTVLASWMGTTGAAMLLIRPLLRANKDRKYKVHTVIFFIFLVANIGGSLTPLGDPPLFLGFLNGISFFWPTQAMFWPMVLVSALVLIVYYLLDRFYYYPHENPAAMKVSDMTPHAPLRVEGLINFLLLVGIVGAVLLSGTWKPDWQPIKLFTVDYKTQNLTRDLLLIVITILSLRLTNNDSRANNGFNWFPIVEVAKLFIGIFLTIAPVIAILKGGADGSLGFIIGLVSATDGQPLPQAYFWATGLLSGFLDNAPTYLVFFKAVGASPDAFMTTFATTLLAISMGAVFMGALSYIGNAPNFMVKAIAENEKVKMPTFFGYMAWSFSVLMPIFVIVMFVFL